MSWTEAVGSDPAGRRSSVATASADLASSRVVAALEAYLDLLKAGRAPDRSAFLAGYPEIAGALGECLDGLDLVCSAAPAFSDAGAAAEAARRPIEGPLPSEMRIGDFRILREIGRGGMGVVYKAEQLSLGRRVALKALPRAAALDPKLIGRFRIEAQAAALLHHAHIVPIYWVGCEQGIHHLAMSLVEGRSLAQVIRELRDRRPAPGSPTGPSSGAELSSSDVVSRLSRPGREAAGVAARLGFQAASALEHAHTQGVVHRDIKPSNLLVDARGDVWVTDFGLARLRESDAGLTQTGDLIGTLRFMSPEQALGRPAAVDERTDIYALGATLYELLTLQPALDGTGREEILRQIDRQEPAPPRRIDPSIPRDLETIVLKAMAKEPSRRYQSAGALADDLRRFLDDRTIDARRPGPIEVAGRWARRHRAIVATASAVFLAAMAVGTALLWVEKRRTQGALDQLRVVHGREREASTRLEAALGREREVNDRLNSTLKREGDFLVRSVRLSGSLISTLMGKLASSGVMTAEEERRYYNEMIAFQEHCARGLAEVPDRRGMAAEAARYAAFLRTYRKEGDADAGYDEAIRILERAILDEPNEAMLRYQLASIYQERGRNEDFGARGARKDGRDDEAADREGKATTHRGREMEVWRRAVADLPDRAIPRLGLAKALDQEAARHALEGREDAATAARDRRDAALRAFLDRAETLAREEGPQAAQDANNLAWALALKPVTSVEDARLALDLGERVVALTRKNPAYWNTLGLARYRAGMWAEAVEALDHALELGGGNPPFDWCIQAMCRWRQGREDEARALFDRAVGAAREKKTRRPDLVGLLGEAASLLGLPEPDLSGGGAGSGSAGPPS